MLDRRVVYTLIILLGIITLSTYHQENRQTLEPNYTYTVVDKYPHDTEAFTQGLVIHNGLFYEGTGLYGSSTLRKVEPETGIVTQSIDLPVEYFGEGITILDSTIYQVTWRQRIGLIYTLELEQIGEFTLTGEGWGLTTDGESLILSDGTSRLSWIDPEIYTTTHTVTVTYEDEEITQINELEYIDGYVYANIWQSDMIAVIHPETGVVASWIDLSGLSDMLDDKSGFNVLNGIAYDLEDDRVYVTGKLWSNVFEIKLVPK